MCVVVVRLPFDWNARRPGQLEDAGAILGATAASPLAWIPAWPALPQPWRGRSPRGAGKAAPKVSFIGQLRPLAASVAPRRPRSGCTNLARCPFFRRSILTLSPAVRH